MTWSGKWDSLASVRVQRAARVREQYAGEAEYTHDFDLGNPLGAPNALGKFDNINHMESHDVACRPDMSRGVPWKVEGFVEPLPATLEGLQPDRVGTCSPASNDV